MMTNLYLIGKSLLVEITGLRGPVGNNSIILGLKK
jgi:hypothetical protein